MADEAKVEAAVQATEAPEKSDRENIEDSLETTDEVAVAPVQEATEENSEVEEMADTITPGGKEVPKDDLSEMDRIIKEATEEPEETPNVQKRINALTAELKTLKAENERLAAERGAKDGKLPHYSDDQLKTALKKAWDDGDSSLAWDIMDHMRKQTKQDLIDMYQGEKNAFIEQKRKNDAEWDETVDAYSKYADTKIPEMWPNSHKDLDLKNGVGMLYSLAMALYWNKDPVKRDYYQKQPGGQKLAVADALTHLMRTKAGKQTNTKVKKLENKLTKERMKKSPVSGGPSGEEKSSRGPASADDVLADVIAERKKYQEEREH